MQSRFALKIASAAALLVLLGGTGFAIVFNSGPAAGGVKSPMASGSVQADAVSNQPLSGVPSRPGTLEQQVQALLDSREAAYRQALNDANSKLQQANAQLQQAYAIIDTFKQAQAASSAATPAPLPPPAQQAQQDHAAQTVQTLQADPAPSYALSPDEAAAIALLVEPSGRLIKTPDLVNFRGAPAYEVQLDIGSVYVDANSRSVLYDAAAPAQTTGGNLSNRQQQESERGDGND